MDVAGAAESKATGCYVWGPLSGFGLFVAVVACVADQAAKLGEEPARRSHRTGNNRARIAYGLTGQQPLGEAHLHGGRKGIPRLSAEQRPKPHIGERCSGSRRGP